MRVSMSVRRSLPVRAALSFCVVLALQASAPAEAQEHRFAFGLAGGWSQPGEMTPGLTSSTKFEAGPLGGAQLEVWPGGGRAGLRLTGLYAERALETQPEEPYRLGTADLALLIRLLSPNSARAFAPFVSIGGGFGIIRGADGAPPFAGGVFGEEPVTRVLVTGGLGVDLFAQRRFGLRLEAMDRVQLLSVGESPPNSGVPMAHEAQLVAALQVRAGRPDRPTTVAAAPVRGVTTPPQTPSAAEVTPATPAAEPAPAAPSAADPAPAATPPAPASSAPAASDLFTVRIGSYLDPATASSWSERLSGRDLPTWIRGNNFGGQSISELRAGAVRTRTEADALARRLADEFGWTVSVEKVAEPAMIAETAITATGRYLGST